MIIVQNNLRENLSHPWSVAGCINGNLGQFYSALYVFSENIGHPSPIKVVIVKEIVPNYWEFTVLGFLPLSMRLILPILRNEKIQVPNAHLKLTLNRYMGMKVLTLRMLGLLSPNTTEGKDLWKSSKPCYVGIYLKVLAEYHQICTQVPEIQSFIHICQYLILTKLAISLLTLEVLTLPMLKLLLS